VHDIKLDNQDTQEIGERVNRLEEIMANSVPMTPVEEPSRSIEKPISTNEMEAILKSRSVDALENCNDIDACKSLVLLVKHYRENGLEDKANQLG